MHYQKTVVMDLSAGARAAGQGPLGCYNGDMPGGFNWCQFGIGVSNPILYQCLAGPLPGPGPGEVCISGGSPATSPPVVYFCMTGAGGDHWGDSCEFGPSAAP
jgi:hypothetical protein